MLNSLNVIIMDMLQQIVEEYCFNLKKIASSHEDHQRLGTQVSLRDIVLLATYLAIKLLIAIEGI